MRISGTLICLCVAAAVLAGAADGAGAAGWPLSFDRLTIYPAGPPSADPRPRSVAVGDVTGDGRPDAVLTVFDAGGPAGADMHLVVFPQLAYGRLGAPERLPLPAWSNQDMGLAVGDIDGDGRADVAVPMQPGLEIFRQRDGHLEPAQLLAGSPPDERDVVVRDMNGDGRADLVLSTDSGPWVMTATAAGGYQSHHLSTYGLPQMGVGDVNADGRPDVIGMTVVVDGAQGRYWGELRTFLQGADGTYPMTTTVWTPGHAGGLAVADLTGDGRDDVAVSRPENQPNSQVHVFAQGAGGLAATPTVYGSDDIPETLTPGDLNGDGRADLVALHGGWDAVGVYLQQPDGQLATEREWALPDGSASHYELDAGAVADLSCDGRRDVALADDNFGLMVLTQTAPPGVAPGSACPSTPAPGAGSSTGTQGSGSPSSSQGSATSPAPASPPAPAATSTPRIGARRCAVPRLVGRRIAAARRALRRAGCGRPRVTHRRSHARAPGRVLAQRPHAGSRLRHGARVRLVVASAQPE